MPFVRVETNVDMDREQATHVAQALSAHVAALLGKPEEYVQVAVHPGVAMTHGGNTAPSAFVAFKTIGLDRAQCAAYSASLCGFLERECGVPPTRTYISFKDLERSRFGWNSGTF